MFILKAGRVRVFRIAADGRSLTTAIIHPVGVGPRSVQVALTHDQLAALVGTSRETATKVLGEFADRGLIRRGRGRITLLDIDGLAAEAGD